MRAEHFNVLWLSEHFVNYRRLLSFSTLDSKWFWLIVGFILPSLTVTKSWKYWNPVAAFQCQGLIPWQPHVISYHYWDCQDNLESVTGCQKKWCNCCNNYRNLVRPPINPKFHCRSCIPSVFDSSNCLSVTFWCLSRGRDRLVAWCLG